MPNDHRQNMRAVGASVVSTRREESFVPLPQQAMYVKMFGENYQPPEYIAAAHREALTHRWYMTARHITMYDDYSFDCDAPIDLSPFDDIIGRHFKQPREGLGNDTSATAHMWRTIIDPTKLL